MNKMCVRDTIGCTVVFSLLGIGLIIMGVL